MNRKVRENLIGWAYILPSFIILVCFIILPIIMSVYFSFTNYNGINTPEFIGIKNYITILKDKYIWISLQNTFVYTLITVPFQTIISMMLAALIAAKFRGKFGNFVKSALFIPVISSAILIGTVWSFLLSTDNGAINVVLEWVGFEAINWLGQRDTAMISICMIAIWKNVGYFLVIFYAGIMDISLSLYEAAEVDGATKRQQFLYITIPCLKPVTYLVITLGIIWSFQVFDMVYAMTKGGPGSSTTTLVYTIYNAAFREYRMGYASSIAIVLFLLIIVSSKFQKRVFKNE